MAGGVVQLVAYGTQDIYLTGNPQITFYKIVYSRHTNFAYETIKQSFINQPNFGSSSTVVLNKNGDLIGSMYLDITLPKLVLSNNNDYTNPDVFWIQGVGNALIKSVEIQIGGQTIDTHYSTWLDIWSELNISGGLRAGYDAMVGNRCPTLLGNNPINVSNFDAIQTYNLIVPLQFWFNRNPGLALPLIALQMHEIRLNFEFRALNELYLVYTTYTDVPAPITPTFIDSTPQLIADLYVDYIFLDTDERRYFAQTPHEYLIEQVQTLSEPFKISYGSATQAPILIPLKFYHPVKEIIWYHNTDAHTNNTTETQTVYVNYADGTSMQTYTPNNWLNYGFFTSLLSLNGGTPANILPSNYSDLYYDTFNTATIQFNGIERFMARNADYFRLVQNSQRHTNIPRVYQHSAFDGDIYMNTFKYIYTYSFAINPEEHQPSGTFNFSRAGLCNMAINYDWSALEAAECTADLYFNVYAVNYNILRVMNGQAGVAYSN